MSSLNKINPIVLFAILLCAIMPPMFMMYPLILCLSLVGAIVTNIIIREEISRKDIRLCLFVFIITALINPLVNHRGVTILFVINDNPITLEACIYGLASAVMMVSVLMWFSVFNYLISSDKILYILGSAAPKTSLMLSMIFRFIPLYRKQLEVTQNVQKTLGGYNKESIPDNIKGHLKVFSSVMTWGFENAITTADSMAARGYGCSRRSNYRIYRFKTSELILLILLVLLTSGFLWLVKNGAATCNFYPSFEFGNLTALDYFVCFIYCFFVFLPAIIEKGGQIRWKYLKSKI